MTMSETVMSKFALNSKVALVTGASRGRYRPCQS
jgi:hypothetical protein